MLVLIRVTRRTIEVDHAVGGDGGAIATTKKTKTTRVPPCIDTEGQAVPLAHIVCPLQLVRTKTLTLCTISRRHMPLCPLSSSKTTRRQSTHSRLSCPRTGHLPLERRRSCISTKPSTRAMHAWKATTPRDSICSTTHGTPSKHCSDGCRLSWLSAIFAIRGCIG